MSVSASRRNDLSQDFCGHTFHLTLKKSSGGWSLCPFLNFKTCRHKIDTELDNNLT